MDNQKSNITKIGIGVVSNLTIQHWLGQSQISEGQK